MRLVPALTFASVCIAAGLAASGSATFAGCQGGHCFLQVASSPVYETRQHDVLVSPERHVARRIPAEYSTVEDTVMVRGPRQVARYVPAEYSTVEETVLLAPGGRRWQVSLDAHGHTVGCWVDVPPHYATQQRQVVTRPAETVYETIPAVTALRERTVMTRAAGIEVRTVPAQYDTVSQRVEVEPAGVFWQPIGGDHDHRYAPRRRCGGLFGGNCRE